MGDSNNVAIGLFLIGVALGWYMPNFPAPLQFLNIYLGIVLIIIAIILFVK